MTSDNATNGSSQTGESTSDNTEAPADGPRRGARPTLLPAELEAVHAAYASALRSAPVDEDTRRAYASRVRQYLAWLGAAAVDGDPLVDPVARDWAVRDYRSFLQSVAKRKPSTVNTVLAALNDFYSRRGLGPAEVRRLDVAQEAPRALEKREAIRWLRVVEGCPHPRDRALALIPFYGGLRIGEAVGLDLDDVRQSARRGLLVVRSGKGDRYREVPLHADLQTAINAWLKERRDWPGAEGPALFLNRRGGRLSARGARDVFARLAETAGLDDEFSSHVLRHTFATTLTRAGSDVVLVADLLGHARLDTTRRYSLASAADRAAALAHLTVDR
ncbi:MAG: tyrosine-type recombinase/integrase [Acidimicrobiales bacterium]